MTIQVHFSIDSTSLIYDVERHLDGLFIAKICVHNGGWRLSHHLPHKIYLYRTTEGWKGDHHHSNLILSIGGQIDTALKQKEF